MSDQESAPLGEEVTITDSELFNEAQGNAPKPAPVEAAPPEVATEKPRDDKGRFAPKVETKVEAKPEVTPEPAPQPVQEDDRTGHIPAWRLREEAEAKREALKNLETERSERQRIQQEYQAMQTRIAALEKPAATPDVPDPLLDPQGYRSYFETQLSERLLNQQREFDMRLAHGKHGELFEKAYAEAQKAINSGDQQLKAVMAQSSSPGETLVNWYRQQQTVREVGNDPNAWLEKKLEERLNDPAFLAKAMERARNKAVANPPLRPAVNLPPSLSGASPGSQMSDPDDGDTSDAALFRQVMRR